HRAEGQEALRLEDLRAISPRAPGGVVVGEQDEAGDWLLAVILGPVVVHVDPTPEVPLAPGLDLDVQETRVAAPLVAGLQQLVNNTPARRRLRVRLAKLLLFPLHLPPPLHL